jgi:predicted transcriptional regulator
VNFPGLSRLRPEELEPRVLEIIRTHGPISVRGICDRLKAASLTAHRTKTVTPILERLQAAIIDG